MALKWIADLAAVTDGVIAGFISAPSESRGAVDARVREVSKQAVAEAVGAAKTVKDAAAAAVKQAAQDLPVHAFTWRGELTRTNLNNAVLASETGCWLLPASRSYDNMPPEVVGKDAIFWVISGDTAQGCTQFIRAKGSAQTFTRHWLVGQQAYASAWSPWKTTGQQANHSEVAAGELKNLDDYRDHGTTVWFDRNGIAGESWSQIGRVTDEGGNILAAMLDVRAATNGQTFQQLQVFGEPKTYPEAGLWARQSKYRNANGSYQWSDWYKLGGSTTGTDVPADAESARMDPVVNAGTINQQLVNDFTMRLGGRKRINTGLVCIRFDHGLNAFDKEIRPTLERLKLPYALALNSRKWDDPQNDQVTAETVNGWVQGGLCEVWNHSAEHIGGATEAAWRDQIQGGLDELREQLPAASIDGFMIPGVIGPDFGGFKMGGSPAQFCATDGGRFLLATHAVISGHTSGTTFRVLDGTVRQGLAHYGIEKTAISTIKSDITKAVKEKRGLCLMSHPHYFKAAAGTAYNTYDDLRGLLEWIAAERDAGRLIVTGVYASYVCDAS